jgi:hypothetical protein
VDGRSGSHPGGSGAAELHGYRRPGSIQQYREQGFEDRYFRGRCGSSLYTDDREKYYVGAGTLGDVTLEPSYHYQVAFKAPWYTIGDGAPQYEEWAPDES